jgi:hypothetical protein
VGIVLMGFCPRTSRAQDRAPLGQIPAVALIDHNLRAVLDGPKLASEWRPQIPNLMGMSLKLGPVGSSDLVVENPKRYLGPNNDLLKKIEIQELSETYWMISIDQKASADVKAFFASGGLTDRDLEIVEIVSTLSASFKGLAGEENAIGKEIGDQLKPSERAMWFTGFTVYRLKHTRYRERERHGAIGVGAVSVNGTVYNKIEDNRLTYIIVPTGYIYTREKGSDKTTFTGPATVRSPIRSLGARRVVMRKVASR